MLEVIIQVKDDVICIPKPEDVKQGDIVEIRVTKIYADAKLKKLLSCKFHIH